MTDPHGDFTSNNAAKKFAIIGVGGYIAKKHLEAIKSINGKILAAFDLCDSVGILDSYCIDCKFFKDSEKFFSYLKSNSVDYISICSPNYTHLNYIQKSLEIGSADNLKQAKICVESVKNLKILKNNKKKYKPKTEIKII